MPKGVHLPLHGTGLSTGLGKGCRKSERPGGHESRRRNPGESGRGEGKRGSPKEDEAWRQPPELTPPRPSTRRGPGGTPALGDPLPLLGPHPGHLGLPVAVAGPGDRTFPGDRGVESEQGTLGPTASGPAPHPRTRPL